MELSARIVSVRRATTSTRILRVRPEGAGFEYEAGQAAMIRPAGEELRVAYSIASAPEDAQADGMLEFLVKADACEKWGPSQPPFRRGLMLIVEGPYGTFVFPRSPAERRFLFVAGGTGIAPVRSMIRHATAHGFGGSLDLLYSARSADEFAYLTEFRDMVRRGLLSLALNVTRARPARWRGSHGRVAEGQLASLLRDVPTLCFVCGPAAMMIDIPPILMALGVEAQRIRVAQW